jgi:isoleucyl-tRNA synthetase
VLAEALVPAVAAETGITGHRVLATFLGTALAGAVCRHPLAGRATSSRCRCWPATS